MSSARAVQLSWESRTAVLDEGGSRPEEVSYPGVAVVHHHDGRVVEQTWVPVGDDPTFADDEALIAALHAAWHWSRHAA
jgi:hypothetical protein